MIFTEEQGKVIEIFFFPGTLQLKLGNNKAELAECALPLTVSAKGKERSPARCSRNPFSLTFADAL